VRTMQMPGFTGDASLYSTATLYRGTGSPGHLLPSGIRPAAFPIIGSPNCIRQCAGSSEGGKPCGSFKCLCECQGGVYSPFGPPKSCGTCRFSREVA
jgi:hypothetical protein